MLALSSLIVYAYPGKVSNAFISMQQAQCYLPIKCKIINLSLCLIYSTCEICKCQQLLCAYLHSLQLFTLKRVVSEIVRTAFAISLQRPIYNLYTIPVCNCGGQLSLATYLVYRFALRVRAPAL